MLTLLLFRGGGAGSIINPVIPTFSGNSSFGISPLQDIRFKVKSDWDVWLLNHHLAHDLIYTSVIASGGVMNKLPLLDAKNANDKDWLNDHQQEHQAIYDNIGLTGMPDLSTVDLDKNDQFDSWHEQHNDIHTLINATLGI